MTDIVKVKQNDVQVYPQTHWNAIEGRPSITTAVATSSSNGLMSKTDKVKLDSLSNIVFEKVGTV